jgi:hypothetical protein
VQENGDEEKEVEEVCEETKEMNNEQRLHVLAFKKFADDKITGMGEEICHLGFGDMMPAKQVLLKAATSLLKKPLLNEFELCAMELSLSSIFNKINPAIEVLYKQLSNQVGPRMSNDPRLIQLSLPIPSKLLHRFWSTDMLLQARSLWYRVLTRKIPTVNYLFRIKRASSSTCQLCNEHEDSLDHFLVFCSQKQVVWYNILQSSFPSECLDLNSIHTTLISLQPPLSLRSTQVSRFLTVLSTAQWFL